MPSAPFFAPTKGVARQAGAALPSPLRGGSGRRPGVGPVRPSATPESASSTSSTTPPGRFAATLPSRGRDRSVCALARLHRRALPRRSGFSGRAALRVACPWMTKREAGVPGASAPSSSPPDAAAGAPLPAGERTARAKPETGEGECRHGISPTRSNEINALRDFHPAPAPILSPCAETRVGFVAVPPMGTPVATVIAWGGTGASARPPT